MEEADGRHFLVMEFVEGPTLAELINGTMPLDRTLPIAGPTCDGGACAVISR